MAGLCGFCISIKVGRIVGGRNFLLTIAVFNMKLNLVPTLSSLTFRPLI